MDLTILKKKISSYRTPKGRVTNLPDELLGEILHAWEQWTGISSGFYSSIGVDSRKAAALIGKAKRLKREGLFDGTDFSEVSIIDHSVSSASLVSATTSAIELVWDNKRIIRFLELATLIEFLKIFEPQGKGKSDQISSEPQELEEAA
jgi:hypothetical protein